jgi:hypothetical protein
MLGYADTPAQLRLLADIGRWRDAADRRMRPATGGMKSDAAADRWDEVHFTVFADPVHEVESDLVIHRDGDVRA